MYHSSDWGFGLGIWVFVCLWSDSDVLESLPNGDRWPWSSFGVFGGVAVASLDGEVFDVTVEDGPDDLGRDESFALLYRASYGGGCHGCLTHINA